MFGCVYKGVTGAAAAPRVCVEGSVEQQRSVTMASIKVPDLLPPNKPSESGRVQVPDFEGPVAVARSAVLSPPKTLDGLVSMSLL